MSKTQVILLGSFFALIAVLFLTPEYRKPGQVQVLFSYDVNELQSITYYGPMAFGHSTADENINFSYQIIPEETSWAGFGYRYIVDIIPDELPAATGQLMKQKIGEPHATFSRFTGGNMIRSLVDDVRTLRYTESFELESGNVEGSEQKNRNQKLQELGLLTCDQYIELELKQKTGKRRFCIGKKIFNDSKRYVKEPESDTIYLIHNYIFSRYEKNIFSYIEFKGLPFAHEAIEKVAITLPDNATFSSDQLNAAVEHLTKISLQSFTLLPAEKAMNAHEQPGHSHNAPGNDKRRWYIQEYSSLEPAAVSNLMHALKRFEITTYLSKGSLKKLKLNKKNAIEVQFTLRGGEVYTVAIHPRVKESEEHLFVPLRQRPAAPGGVIAGDLLAGMYRPADERELGLALKQLVARISEQRKAAEQQRLLKQKKTIPGVERPPH